jgi:cell fate regulator YaaT (PSP1 superfamily)
MIDIILVNFESTPKLEYKCKLATTPRKGEVICIENEVAEWFSDNETLVRVTQVEHSPNHKFIKVYINPYE